MWLWRQPARHKKYNFLLKLIGISTAFHLVVLFIWLFVYKGDLFTHTIQLNQSAATIFFLPFQKTVASSSGVTGSGSGAAQQSNKGAEHGADFKVVNVGANQENSAHAVAAQESKTTMITNSGWQRKKKAAEQKKKGAQKQNKKVSAKKVEKVTPEKKVPAKKENKTVEPTKPEEKAPVVVPVQQSDAPAGVPGGEGAEQGSVMYAGQLDMEALELREAIREEVEQKWRPPLGLACGRGCKVRVLIDWSGHVQDIVFEESSQVVAFDQSVRHALLSMTFPKNSYGKELILPFYSGE
jgi:outer membrane biosynthesis protein TonB